MKANSLRSRILLVLSILLLLTFTCGALSFGGTKVNASADLENAVSSFKMLDKQQLRTEDRVGMRFAATMSVEEYAALTGENSAYTAVDFGFFIMPKYYEKAGAINYDNTFGSDAVFTWEGKTGTTTVADPYEILHADGVQAVLGKVEENGEDLYLIKGSLVDIHDQNLATKFTARMYVKATKADSSVVYAFADQMTTASSMVDVAIRGIEQGDSALQSYVDKYVAYYKAANDGAEPTYSYTVNYYVDGTATPVKSEVVSGNAINTPVSITATAPDGYILDSANASKNVLSGKVYADNDLALSVYVKELKEIEGAKNNGELFYFGKNTTNATGYAGAYVEDGYYKVTMPESFTATKISALSIGGTTITDFSFENKVLKVSLDEVVALKNGVVDMLLTADDCEYKAKVTIANSVIYNVADFVAILNNKTTIGASGANNSVYIVLDGDIDWGSNDSFPAGWGFNLYGEVDGKGYAVKNMKTTAYIFQSIQGGGAVKNIAFTNVIYQGSNGFLCYQAGAISIENVFVSYAAGTSNGLVGEMTQNLTLNNVVVICNDASYGYIGKYTNGKTLTITNSYCITTATAAVKTSGGDGDTTGVYTSAQATVCENAAELMSKSDNAKNFDSKYWSVKSGCIYFGDKVVLTNSVALKGDKNGGELFYFSKDVTTPTGYAAAYVEDGYYKVTMPSIFTDTTIESVILAGNTITGCSFANGVLKVPTSAVATISSGVQKMQLICANAVYEVTVTVADYVIATQSDISILQTFSTGLVVLNNTIEWTGSTPYAKGNNHLYGTFDGKGYAIKGIVLAGTGGTGGSAGLFETVQAGGKICNLAMLNVTFSGTWNGGVLARAVASATFENIMISIDRRLANGGIVGHFDGGTHTLKNVIVKFSGNYGSDGAFAKTYSNSANLSIENAYAISNLDALMTENTSNTNINFANLNSQTICADLAALLTKSENLKNFDSNYWSLKNGSIYFGDEVVVAAAVAE